MIRRSSGLFFIFSITSFSWSTPWPTKQVFYFKNLLQFPVPILHVYLRVFLFQQRQDAAVSVTSPISKLQINQKMFKLGLVTVNSSTLKKKRSKCNIYWGLHAAELFFLYNELGIQYCIFKFLWFASSNSQLKVFRKIVRKTGCCERMDKGKTICPVHFVAGE